MRRIIYLLTLLFTANVFGQTKDTRAELEIKGRADEISVSPDEKIWLVTAMGNTYYTNNIDSDWHYGKPLFESSDEFSIGNPNLGRVSFFNKDTAIMTGYISVSKEDFKNNGYYLTTDAGITWKLLDFGGDSWIYNAFVDKQGNAWMGGSSGEIYFSNDFGQHWEKLNSPYDSFSRMHCIFMINSTSGISGALHNEIYFTSDNWKTNTKIATPIDQKKYSKDDVYSDDRIEKILLWDNHIVVNQNGHVFYTSLDRVDWKPFPVKIIDFEIDNDSNILFAVTDNLKIAQFISPNEYDYLTDSSLSDSPIDMKIVNHSLYVLTVDHGIYRVNKSGLTYSRPYTTDKPISEPQIVKQGTRLSWGITGNQIYLRDNKGFWYRENALDFGISDFILLSDSLAILWDGIKDNYLYSLQDHSLKKYFPESPLETFLAFPVRTFSIKAGSQGCFHKITYEVSYERTNDSTFATNNFTVVNYDDKDHSRFKNQASGLTLLDVLKQINHNPPYVPSLKDFQITEADKKNYLLLVDKQLLNNDYDNLRGKKKIDKAFYYSVPSMLDTLNDSIVTAVLNQREGVWSTTSNWFTIQIVNENMDSLQISRNYYVSSLPWNLPWTFEYKGMYFSCYNINFSRFINTCIPVGFMNKEFFDNSVLIMGIADFLWNKEE